MNDTTDLRVEITDLVDRANALNDQHGAVGVADCLAADDLATLERAGAICTFIAAIHEGQGQPELQHRMGATAAVLLLTARELRGADNWPARNMEER